MASDTHDLSAFLKPHLCANTDRRVDGEISPCDQPASMVCSSCYLVQYCSQACQKADWKNHKATCKSELLTKEWRPRFIARKYTPTFMAPSEKGNFGLTGFGSNQYLWGYVPAIDILQVDRNEGKEDAVTRDFALLFAASGDMRNVVKTIVGIPENCTGECVVAVNDKDFCVTARNIIMILTAMQFNPETAVPMILHVWYSALLPLPMVHALQDGILPRIKQVCERISDEKDDSEHVEVLDFGEHRSVRVVLKKKQWAELANMLQPRRDLSALEAIQLRHGTTMASHRADFVDKTLLKMSPGQRTGTWRFRVEGILLPYGASRRQFAVPNPTLFATKDLWPMKDDADPLNGWSHHEYAAYAGAAKNDMYGALFNFLRGLLLSFCKRIKALKISFHFSAVDAVKLPLYLHVKRFDRIEVSNICDRGYIGISTTLSTFAPLLKPKSQNAHSTLLLLFLNAVREEEARADSQNWTVAPSAAAPDPQRLARVRRYLPNIAAMVQRPDVIDHALRNGLPSAAEPIKLADAIDMFGDFEEHFRMFLRRPDMRETGSMRMLCVAHGVRVRKKYSIVEQWPFRVTERTTQAQFEVLLAQGTWGHERYVEVEVEGDDYDEVSEMDVFERLALE